MVVGKFDLIVFDWDGTLMDSTARIVSSLQKASALSGLPVPSDEAAAGIIGLSLDQAFTELFRPASITAQQRDELMDHYRQQFVVDNPQPMPMFAGSSALLALLQRNQKQLAVATGKSRKGLDRVLEETGVGQYFHATICADEAESKPHPDMLHRLMAIFNVKPEKTLMIGDTDYDLQMAENAGAKSIGVTYGAQPKERLLPFSSLALVDSVAELRDCLLQPC
ncbi:HAD family hydrolase [Corallincola holothuriorum]|uniref:HAD family hydrolase n=1 Tax=Corallincola holothuriorum TaxID=2282215 RepID=A0A368NRU4_9GAMM|nr:HAD family hydrolase [Corallincola holothuriorum]